ncbi:MAG: hypothetical protein LBK73_13495 [Treponema sp.]|jgi:hypothetical protein|nr:hypothetical protein [Treponema sp.]
MVQGKSFDMEEEFSGLDFIRSGSSNGLSKQWGHSISDRISPSWKLVKTVPRHRTKVCGHLPDVGRRIMDEVRRPFGSTVRKLSNCEGLHGKPACRHFLLASPTLTALKWSPFRARY